MLDKAKSFLYDVKELGLQSALAGAAGLFFFVFTEFSLLSGVCFGVFLTRNWDIIKKYATDKVNI